MMYRSVCMAVLLCCYLNHVSHAFTRSSASRTTTNTRPSIYSLRKNSVVDTHHHNVRGSALSVVSDSTNVAIESDQEDNDDRSDAQNQLKKKSSRWAQLDPKIKAKIVRKGQQKAIANKKKREPIQDKKRRT